MNKAIEQNDNRLILLSADDNVLVARAPIAAGEIVLLNGMQVRVGAALSMGYKLARCDISQGEKVLKYGAPIGSATMNIKPGDLVHLHNLKSDYTATHSLQSARAQHEADETEGRT